MNNSSIKLFIGLHLTNEMQYLLNQSSVWKKAKIDPSLLEISLKTTYCNNLPYIGVLTDKSFASYAEIKKIAQLIVKTLYKISPKINITTKKIIIYPQFYIG